VIVTDDDIDIFDPVDLEWAVATRVQADRDVVIVSNARSKPLDPSLPPVNGIPTTAKMGIDATIPENVPRERYNRIVYVNEGKTKLKDYLGAAGVPARKKTKRAGSQAAKPLTERIMGVLSKSHKFYAEILDLFPGEEFVEIARTVGRLSQERKITQDGEGRYQLVEAGLSQTR
jgi:2,5-furandicarboxylate decarboxylase 1